MASYVSGASASANTAQGGDSQYPHYYSHTRTSQGEIRDEGEGRFHTTDDEHLDLSDDYLSDGAPHCGHSHNHSRRDGDRHRQCAPRLYEDPVPANIMVPTLSLEQLLEETSVAGGLLGGRTERDVEQLLEEFSALCPGDQITALRCMAASFYRDALFAPYACMHLIANRMRVHYAREVVHVAEDLADAMSANSGVCFRRYRKRVLEDMLAEEMGVYNYLARANSDICEDNLLSAVETLLRRFRRMGCYRSLCMLKILALQHEDLAGFIRRSIRKTCNFAHARTHTVYV
ncbi:NF-kappaB pathway inhibitor [Orf virus]|uniref:NF-kappaB pathway inhibitor n=1 Tax=Orf virus TaxID=10258 RepID=A0A0F6N1L9_ORFV|nr:NF-kappaB pathway inhibitor [Orf virus]ASY92320.1 NF-kappaB pathway inhibitor [Orf virus]